MPDQTVQASNPATAAESENNPTTPNQSDTILQRILDTMHESDVFPRTGEDAPSRFWSAYERVARQHDDEFIERHNGEMDVLLIFAGLFSAVSSAFIVNMQSSLNPIPSDTTNALLKMVINKLDNTTFPEQEASLPVWTGPSSMTVWIQTLAYSSLSTSLLAAFGAVLGKQWLGHYKTSRFGRGALHERCQRRQQKLDGLEAWHFSTIIATLPIFLQLSLLFFGIALAANIWTQQHTVASVIMATTAFGFIFYFFTVVSSLKSPDCPFQTPVSVMLQHILRDTAALRTEIRRKWKGRPKTWEGFLDGLQESLRRALDTTNSMITKSIAPLVAYLSRMPSAWRRVRLWANDPEAAGGSEQSQTAACVEQTAAETTEDQAAFSVELDSSLRALPVEITRAHAVQAGAVQWILETSTDTDVIAAAARMVPEIEWPADNNIVGVMDRLKSNFYACFDPTQQILPLAQAGAVAYLKATCHSYVERDMDKSLYILTGGSIHSSDNHHMYHMLPDQAFMVIESAVHFADKLDITSLSLSERMWMAHMFTYRLHKDDYPPESVTFVIDFIAICLDSKSPSRLVADCLLLAGLLIGVQVDRRHLARLDKSQAIGKLQLSVMNRTLGVLIGDIPGRPWHYNIAVQLVHPLLQYTDKNVTYGPRDSDSDRRFLQRASKFCFRLLELMGTPGDDQIRSKTLDLLIRILSRQTWVRDGRPSHTPAQFDLLVEYYLHISKGTDYDTIRATLRVLTWLHGLPSTQDQTRCYIDTTMRSMGEEPVCFEALRATSVAWSVVVSMGREDESFRERFSRALTSAVLLNATQAPLDDNPFSFLSPYRNIPYLMLLSTLSQEHTWQPQLHQDGHFDNCLAIADTLSIQIDHSFDECALHVAHIFASIDASGDESLCFNTVREYPCWPLILRAWRHIFGFQFFDEATEDSWQQIAGIGSLESLPPLVAYASRRRGIREEPLIRLVEQVCHKLDEQRQQCEEGEAQPIQDSAFGHRGIPVLGAQIREMLDASLGHV